ncbi:hypothetical protein AWZ03_008147 [Drosophila navojoa]|uniref:Large ribosomal subunit protein uL4m n=1 Tax=Drosophila navojoa TaxID=7232 RepID=A0A484BC41_DRONA|nr:hypothetical protein AWZ03_008147 [Drosophila navojoa]
MTGLRKKRRSSKQILLRKAIKRTSDVADLPKTRTSPQAKTITAMSSINRDAQLRQVMQQCLSSNSASGWEPREHLYDGSNLRSANSIPKRNFINEIRLDREPSRSSKRSRASSSGYPSSWNLDTSRCDEMDDSFADRISLSKFLNCKPKVGRNLAQRKKKCSTGVQSATWEEEDAQVEQLKGPLGSSPGSSSRSAANTVRSLDSRSVSKTDSKLCSTQGSGLVSDSKSYQVPGKSSSRFTDKSATKLDRKQVISTGSAEECHSICPNCGININAFIQNSKTNKNGCQPPVQSNPSKQPGKGKSFENNDRRKESGTKPHCKCATCTRECKRCKILPAEGKKSEPLVNLVVSDKCNIQQLIEILNETSAKLEEQQNLVNQCVGKPATAETNPDVCNFDGNIANSNWTSSNPNNMDKHQMMGNHNTQANWSQNNPNVNYNSPPPNAYPQYDPRISQGYQGPNAGTVPNSVRILTQTEWDYPDPAAGAYQPNASFRVTACQSNAATEITSTAGKETLASKPALILPQNYAEHAPVSRSAARQAWIENVDAVAERKIGLMELHPDVFAAQPRVDVIQENIEWQRKYRYVSMAHTKTRAEVRGGGRKPWPQKGMGRARHGSIRSPLFKGGGVIHGPRSPTTHFYMLPFYKRVMGLTSTLSVKLAQDDLHIIEDVEIPTKDAQFIRDLIKERNWGPSVLIVDKHDVFPENICYATDSIGYVNLMPAYGLNVYSMLKHDTLVLTVEAVKHLEERLLYQLHRNDGASKQTKLKLDQV